MGPFLTSSWVLRAMLPTGRPPSAVKDRPVHRFEEAPRLSLFTLPEVWRVCLNSMRQRWKAHQTRASINRFE
jgi:hypothetical protein